MLRKLNLFVSLSLLALLFSNGGAIAQENAPEPSAAPLGSAITYQGRLSDQGSPANGSYDLRFILYDAEVGGTQVGSILALEDVLVSEGYFRVMLDFGSGTFSGQACWLEIAVRPGSSSGEYTTLSPRQALSAVPYAQYSQGAPWSGLSGVPAGLADGVDNDTTYTASIGLNLAGGQFSVNFAGSGTAATAAHSDHNHMGQTWTGNNNPLQIEGSFYGSASPAPLVLNNAFGSGLYVGAVGRSGVYVGSAGSPSSIAYSVFPHGIEVDGAEGDGLFVGRADRSGVEVVSAGFSGVAVFNADTIGVFVREAGSPSSYIGSTTNNGFEVAGAQGYGLYVGRADLDGVYVNSAAWHGLNVAEAGVNGVYVTGAGNHGISAAGTNLAGYFNGNIQVTGSCTGCSMAAFGINTSSDPLEPGDMVTILGTEASGVDSTPVVWKVASASSGQAVVGVVGGKAEMVTEQSKRPNELGKTLVPREGSAAPGEFVTVIIYGPAQVKVSGSGKVAIGERLVVDDLGMARALMTTEVNGIQVAESAPTIGIALDTPDVNGLVWVLVNPQ